jgi:hypothetical protein
MHPAVESTRPMSAVRTTQATTILRKRDPSIERIRVLKSLPTERSQENTTKIFMLKPNKCPNQSKPTRSHLYLSYNFLGRDGDPTFDAICKSLSTTSGAFSKYVSRRLIFASMALQVSLDLLHFSVLPSKERTIFSSP